MTVRHEPDLPMMGVTRPLRGVKRPLIVKATELASILELSKSMITRLTASSRIVEHDMAGLGDKRMRYIDLTSTYMLWRGSDNERLNAYADKIDLAYPDMADEALRDSQGWVISDIPSVVDDIPVAKPRTTMEARTLIRTWQDAEDAKRQHRLNQVESGELVQIAIVNDLVENLLAGVDTILGDGFAAWARSYGLPDEAWIEYRGRLYNAFKAIIDDTAVKLGQEPVTDPDIEEVELVPGTVRDADGFTRASVLDEAESLLNR